VHPSPNRLYHDNYLTLFLGPLISNDTTRVIVLLQIIKLNPYKAEITSSPIQRWRVRAKLDIPDRGFRSAEGISGEIQGKYVQGGIMNALPPPPPLYRGTSKANFAINSATSTAQLLMN
jgi:hypothetical protein